MRVVGYRQPGVLGDPHYLLDLELPDPVPGPLDLLVQVEAVAVNPVDLKVRGRETPAAGQTRVLGWDAVGRVVAHGSGCRTFALGDRVWYAGALDRPGCQAERHLVDHRLAALAPRSLAPSAAAAFPLTTITAWELLFDRLGLPMDRTAGCGDCLLVIGAAGGVGSMLLQLARQFTGLTLVATAGSPEGRAWALRQGAHHVLDHGQPLHPQFAVLDAGPLRWAASLSHSVQHFDAVVELLAPQGALALIDDPPPKSIDVLALKRKSLSLHWEFMFTRSLYGTPDLSAQGALLARTAELVDLGLLRSTMAACLGPISAHTLMSAHRRLAAGHSIGKLVLEGWA